MIKEQPMQVCHMSYRVNSAFTTLIAVCFLAVPPDVVPLYVWPFILAFEKFLSGLFIYNSPGITLSKFFVKLFEKEDYKFAYPKIFADRFIMIMSIAWGCLSLFDVPFMPTMMAIVFALLSTIDLVFGFCVACWSSSYWHMLMETFGTKTGIDENVSVKIEVKTTVEPLSSNSEQAKAENNP